MKQQILPKKMKHKLQKVDTNRLQDQRKKKKNQKTTPNPPIELKTNLKLKWTQHPQTKSTGPYWPGWKSKYEHRSDQ